MATIGLDHCLVVRTDSIHRVQECHVAIYHILWDLVHTLLADDRDLATNRPAVRAIGSQA
jgi:D-sedoheptulose 7-phosphate isomerase